MSRLHSWAAALALLGSVACNSGMGQTGEGAARAEGCQLVEQGFGPDGSLAIEARPLVRGLEVPWSIAFLPGGDYLVTERPGRVRLVRGGALVTEPVVEISVGEAGEGGLLGIAVDPRFAENRLFYVYYTAVKQSGTVNRVERYRLSEDLASATPDRVILDDVPAGPFHNGGRIRFGPDGMLYVGTGDARDPAIAQDPQSPAGKILRMTPDGGVPADNPLPGLLTYLLGIRNTQGFDWLAPDTLAVTDHGPTGELGRTGADELNFARAGENLGWPTSWRCEAGEGMLAPALAWNEALPPGGAALYRGSLYISSLGAKHLQRVVLAPDGSHRVEGHEVYLRGDPDSGGLGRLREAIVSPSGALWVTTSNCDGRGECGPERDGIFEIKVP